MIYISPHYVRVALKSAQRKGLDSQAMFSACGIQPEELEHAAHGIHPEKFCKLWQYLWQALDDEFLGFTKKPSKRGTFALACKLACQTPSFKHLFREVNRIYHLVDSDVIISAQRTAPDQIHLRLDNKAPQHDIEHFITEYFLFYWHRLACWVSNKKIKPIRAEFSYPAPAHASLYQDLFQCPIIFDTPSTQLVFDSGFFEMQPIRSRREIYDFLNRLPADFMSLPGEHSSLETRIKVLILNQSKDKLVFPPLEQLAQQLHMSRTSLGRKLAAENTSYQQLKVFIRRDLSMEKLRLTRMSITDIAELVGFSEATSLNRAFKDWTGMTPQQFRGQHEQID